MEIVIFIICVLAWLFFPRSPSSDDPKPMSEDLPLLSNDKLLLAIADEADELEKLGTLPTELQHSPSIADLVRKRKDNMDRLCLEVLSRGSVHKQEKFRTTISAPHVFSAAVQYAKELEESGVSKQDAAVRAVQEKLFIANGVQYLTRWDIPGPANATPHPRPSRQAVEGLYRTLVRRQKDVFAPTSSETVDQESSSEWAPVVFILFVATIALLCIASGLYSAVTTVLFLQRAVEVPGRVTEVREYFKNGHRISYVVEYVDLSGQTRTWREDVLHEISAKPAFTKYQRVRVLYDPSAPESPPHARIRTFGNLWGVSLFLVFFGGGWMALLMPLVRASGWPLRSQQGPPPASSR